MLCNLPLYTIHAPGIGRVTGVCGDRKYVAQRIRDRKVDGTGYKRERLSQLRVDVVFDGRNFSFYDVNIDNR